MFTVALIISNFLSLTTWGYFGWYFSKLGTNERNEPDNHGVERPLFNHRTDRVCATLAVAATLLSCHSANGQGHSGRTTLRCNLCPINPWPLCWDSRTECQPEWRFLWCAHLLIMYKALHYRFIKEWATNDSNFHTLLTQAGWKQKHWGKNLWHLFILLCWLSTKA